jgi:hypothetical protein
MQLLQGAVIGMQGCKVNTFRDLDDAVAAGRRDDAFVSIFGNTVNTVAQVSSSEIFFPAGVRFHLLSMPGVWIVRPQVHANAVFITPERTPCHMRPENQQSAVNATPAQSTHSHECE